MKNYFKSFFTIFLLLVFSISAFANQKLTAEEIIAKHLDSIGTKEKRAEINNQLILCSVQFIYQGSATIVNGNGVFASAGEKNLLGMMLTSNDYPQDKFSFDGEKTRVAFTKPGVYSVLGDFVFSYKNLLKDGLLGGTLFSSWALHHNEKRQAKLTAAGTKKIGSVETYVIEYSPKGGFDLEIKMFFDTKNFRHVRTEYFKLIAARQASTIDASAGQSSDRIQVIEDFSDYQVMGGLTLPSKYSLNYNYYNNSPTQASKARNRELQWKFQVTNFSYNQELDANSFTIDTN